MLRCCVDLASSSRIPDQWRFQAETDVPSTPAGGCGLMWAEGSVRARANWPTLSRGFRRGVAAHPPRLLVPE
eukprot:11709635-Alexandrium_andersonii.AAC.1